MKKDVCISKHCSVEKTLNIIGKKWALLIIRDLLGGAKRYNELMESLGDITPRALSIRLSELKKDKLITKKILKGTPLKVEYSLTQKGKDLASIVDQMRKWGDKYGA